MECGELGAHVVKLPPFRLVEVGELDLIARRGRKRPDLLLRARQQRVARGATSLRRAVGALIIAVVVAEARSVVAIVRRAHAVDLSVDHRVLRRVGDARHRASDGGAHASPSVPMTVARRPPRDEL